MKNKFTLLFIFILTLTSFHEVVSQEATIKGKVVDGDFNDVLPFANILVKGTSVGTTSDFEGNYELSLQPGNYTLSFSFVGYQTKEITDVELTPGQEVNINVTLNSGKLDEIVITTTLRNNSESAVLSFQKNSVNLLDGLSLETIKKTGASNIASAVKSIPGVSIQGGKYVYVRGLGDRYTKSTLNGMDIPGLNPDRNTLQLDLFPTKILENVVVVKSATADQPADFTGGVVDIVTRSIPGKEEYSVNLGLAYNSDFHFKSNYLTQPNSGTDIFGFDDGLRSNPIPAAQEIPLPQQNGEVVSILTRRFEKDLAAQRDQSLMDMNFSITAGNQFDVGNDNKLGFFGSLSYRNETQYFDEYVDGQIFRKDEADKTNYNLLLDRGQSGELGNNNVLISGLLGTTFKTEKSKYTLNFLHIQNAESENSIFRQVNGIISSNEVKKDNLTYVERSISNVLLGGKHSFLEDGSLELEWKISPSYATIYDKDFRVTPFRVIIDPETGNESFVIEPSESGDAGRFWRELEEYNIPGKIDATYGHTLFGYDAEIKAGGAYTFKNRTFDVTRFSFPFLNFQSVALGGNPDNLLLESNIYDPDTNSGVFVRKDSSDSDKFDSDMTVSAGYLSESFKVKEWMRLILGVRFEQFTLTYTGQRQDGSVFNNATILDKSDLFPSANLIFDLNEDDNTKIRTSYSRTTARPSFKEASLAEIFDPISSNTFIGNLELQPTYIDNFDL
ncbi:MAG: TonB-dependent receptor, partial [Flavobacterium sp.]